MEELQPGFWLSLLTLFLGLDGSHPAPGPAGSDFAALADYMAYAVEESSTYELTYAVEEAYAVPGISLNDSLTWQFQPFDGLVNWYNEQTQVINLSEFPADDEVDAYWDTWSGALTRGRWDWRAFFANADEARSMARFNQFVLAAHEYGHALTYRYDPDHNARAGNEINCRELPADRLAAGLLEELAAVQSRFAAWRQRYADLVAAINAEVDPAIRATLSDYAGLDADCRILHVEQPDATTMAPYASAYFARWQVLLATDLPPLADLYDTYLYPHWRAALPAAAPLAGPVSSPGWVDGEVSGPFDHGRETGWHLPAFAPDGRLYVLDYAIAGTDSHTGLYLAFGPAGSKRKVMLDTSRLYADLDNPAYFDINAFLPLGPDRFVIASADLFGLAGSVVVIVVERMPGGWIHRLAQPLPGIGNLDTRLRRRADGTVRLDLYRPGTQGETASWQSYSLDLDTLVAGAPETLPDTPYAWYNDMSDGRPLLVDAERPMVLVGADPAPLRIAGNGLQGFKDRLDPFEAEFVDPLAAIALADRIRVLDTDPLTGLLVIREVELGQ